MRLIFYLLTIGYRGYRAGFRISPEDGARAYSTGSDPRVKEEDCT